ncbi:hypothetical protein BDV96DRAFT_568081, partial [Lophiotrema nucula]
MLFELDIQWYILTRCPPCMLGDDARSFVNPRPSRSKYLSFFHASSAFRYLPKITHSDGSNTSTHHDHASPSKSTLDPIFIRPTMPCPKLATYIRVNDHRCLATPIPISLHTTFKCFLSPIPANASHICNFHQEPSTRFASGPIQDTLRTALSSQ